MWWVRSDLLGRQTAAEGERGADATSAIGKEDISTAYREMVYSFWSQAYSAVEAPRQFPGKLLAHSPTFVHWDRIFTEAAAASVALTSWSESLLGQTQLGGTAAPQPQGHR